MKKLLVVLLVAAPFLGSARVQAGNDETFAQTVRQFYWIVMGFPSAAKYDSTLGTGSEGEARKKVVPQAGLASLMETVRSSLVQKILEAQPVASCQDAPTSGTIEPSSTEKIEFMAATVSAPSSFPNTGKYDKALIYTKTTTTGKEVVNFQWKCDMAAMFAKFDYYTGSTKVLRFAVYYDRTNSDNGHVQFYMYDPSKTLSSSEMVLGLHVNVLADNKFKMYLTRSGVNGSAVEAYRAVAHSNYSSQKTTIVYQDISNSAKTEAQVGGTDSTFAAYFSDKTVTGGVAPASSSGPSKVQVCVDTFDQKYQTVTSATGCSGLDVNEAPAPGLDSTGDMSMKWVHNNLKTKMDAL